MNTTIRLILEYRGEGFCGWQKQPELRSIQGALEEALRTVIRGEVSTPLASGRTDAGVHARRQVVTFSCDLKDTPLEKIVVGISSILKNEVSVLKAEEVSAEFHPVRDALRKQYTYQIHNASTPAVHLYRSVSHVVKPLNLDRMRQEAVALVGEHDFSSFRGSGCGAKSPVRTLESITIEPQEQLVLLHFIGQGFLKQMVRNMVGTLIQFGIGKAEGTSCAEILSKRDRRAAGPTAEPFGLFLDWVEYPEGRL